MLSGMHTYQFTAYGADDSAVSNAFCTYGYTPLSPTLEAYIRDAGVVLASTPGAQSGSKLSQNAMVTVTGIYGKYSLVTSATQTGFVPSAVLVTQAISADKTILEITSSEAGGIPYTFTDAIGFCVYIDTLSTVTKVDVQVHAPGETQDTVFTLTQSVATDSGIRFTLPLSMATSGTYVLDVTPYINGVAVSQQTHK